MRFLTVAVLAAMALGATGCTTVKMAQRDGCWVRETKKTLRGTKQELGPCSRPQPQWVEDRLTRLVQECIAQADYRWQVAATSAWSRNEPLPAQDSQQTVIETCMNEAAGGSIVQNETLRARLAEVSEDREALRGDVRRSDEHLRSTNEKLAEFLGEAARRPPPVATATASATSDGTATNDNGVQSETGSTSQTQPAVERAAPEAAPQPVAPAVQPAAPAVQPVAPAAQVVAPAAPALAVERAAPPPAAKAATKARTPARRAVARSARGPDCEVPPGVTAAAPASPETGGSR